MNHAPSSESRVLRPRRAAPADAVRPTRAEVNLAALRHNLRVVERYASGRRVLSVLKADAYGHGAPAVARTLERSGAHAFAVALLEEAIELREAGILAPIVVLGGYYGNAYQEVVAHNLTPVVYHAGHLEEFARLVRTQTRASPIDVHIKIDTGMARLGVTMRGLKDFAEALRETPEVHVTGLLTHLACADAPTNQETRAQMGRFEEATAWLAAWGVRPNLRHAANSAGLLRGEGLLDAVRPGIALFGVSPEREGVPLTTELRPVMRVRTEIIDLRDVEPGATVGYGAEWRATRLSRVATVPMGYADGLPRQLWSRGSLLVRGKRAPIVGAISMDMTMIDVTDIDGAALRDEVVVLGSQEGPLGQASICADELARLTGTIPWDILTGISRRVPRFFREP